MSKTYVSFSTGVDSTALAILLHEQGHDITLVMADTGAEFPESYWMAPRVAERLGCDLEVVCNGSFFAYLVSFGWLLPSVHRRWCTRLLKQAPLNNYIADKDGEYAVGIRSDEAHRMEGAWRPLIDAGMDKKDCTALCEKYGLVNPIYRWRSSLSCFCCPMSRIVDWRKLAHEYPHLFAQAEEWERLSAQNSKGFTWIKGKTLTEMRNVEESQIALWEEPTETACAICQW